MVLTVNSEALVPGGRGTAGLGVLVEEGHPAEGFVAARAGVLLVLEVGLEVGPQVGLVGEPPGAVGAGEGLLPGVGPHVSLQQPGPGERFAALGTLAGQGVGLDVHLEGGLGGVGLLAVLAGEVLLDLVGGVEQKMVVIAGLA